MSNRQRRAGLTARAVAAFALCLALPALARAQEEEAPARAAAQRQNEVNHEVQLFLLAAAADGAARGQLPESLSGVARQLRATLPPGGYRVVLTLLNRVRDGSNVEFSGIGAPLLWPPAGSAAAPPTPTTFSYSLGNVRLTEDAAGGRLIHLRPLRFAARVPVQAGTARGEGGSERPVFNTQETGLTTEISVREGEPTVVGTVATGRPDDLFVLVVTVRRAGR